MKNQKLTPGEQLYAASNNIDFWKWYIQEKENKARIKAEKKEYWDAKFFENKLKNPQPAENPIVIADNAPKYKHNRFGIGVLVSD
jgi:thymidylate synthase